MASSSTTGRSSSEDGGKLLEDARAERLARAHGYPYPYPEQSYLYVDGIALPLIATEADPLRSGEVDIAGRRVGVLDHLAAIGAGATAREPRIPLIAYGSNRAPVQLGRKYGHLNEHVVIPVVHGWLKDVDVVYAARLAGYGSVAATVAMCPGTTASISVIWLTESQLELMHATEGVQESVYAYGRLDEIDLTLDGGAALDSLFAYVNQDGAIIDDGAPVALAAVPARDRVFPARDQLAMLARVRDRLEPGVDLEQFVLDHIDQPVLRIERSRNLALDARQFDHPRFTRLLG